MHQNARLIITFSTLHQVLTAEKALRAANPAVFKIRPTPTPPGLSTSICGMSIEILEQDQKQEIMDFLQSNSLQPSGLYTVA
jgi:hypothetical protein